ncbi:MAG: hypothetical protein HY694_12015 [Deltaproteobacteria bacterium]|nr:hypothetical protein [Deltaproteobacteria bacterium]
MFKSRLLAVILFMFLLSAIQGSEVRAESLWKEAGLGVASVLGSAIYSPVKVQYAALGTVAGGVAWVVTAGNTELAQKIWEPALSGDYVITPQMLRDSKSSSRP